MLCERVLVALLLLANTCVWCHPSYERHHSVSQAPDETGSLSFSPRRLEKMMEKAILKIITGDLNPSDMQLLKSLNYSLDQVLAIRQRELDKKMDEELRIRHQKKTLEPEIDYEEFNRKAVEDYENLANKMEHEYKPMDYEIVEDKKVVEDDGFSRPIEPHVIFKIRYDDSEFDSSSLEKSKEPLATNSVEGMRIVGGSKSLMRSNPTTPLPSTPASSPPPLRPAPGLIQESNRTNEIQVDNETEKPKRISPYEGLEWVEDDVYRVIPEALNYGVDNYEEFNETLEAEYPAANSSLEEMTNDYFGYQGDQEAVNDTTGNLTGYRQLALAHRRGVNHSIIDSQGQRAIEDIKMRVLALTGRFNLSTNTNLVQRERLTKFSPTCQIPKNTDAEVWSDAFSMNMYFQLNLTSNDHIVAAKLRIYKLPQMNQTSSTSSVPGLEYEEEEEKKIRISIYFYTKSLKKHRSKKRLMDSIVTSLTPEGGHLALDVRQALRFWRQPARVSHPVSNNNHGLVIQVEDQDGRPLKPTMYLQQDACHMNPDDTDEKINDSLQSSFKPVLVMFES